MTKKEEILMGLEPLFIKAEKEKLWFYASYQDSWFSPQELKEKHNENRFLWGACNWELRNPYEIIEQAERRIENYRKELIILKNKIEKWEKA